MQMHNKHRHGTGRRLRPPPTLNRPRPCSAALLREHYTS